jgi:hypothetical protein
LRILGVRQIARHHWRDPATGLDLTKVVREVDDGVRVRRTHVVSTVCGAVATAGGPSRSRPFIVAVRSWSIAPSSAAAVEDRARFASVHVREPTTGRIRFYRNVSPVELTQLARRLLPYCVPT